MSNTDNLINHAGIADAEARAVALLRRKLAAPAVIDAAARDVRTAEAAYKNSIVEGNPAKARKALADAKAALIDAQDARDALEHAAAKAQAGIPAVKRTAHLPLVRHLLDAQMDLAREADVIRTALADVEMRWAGNIAQLHGCHLSVEEMQSIAAGVLLLAPTNTPPTRMVRTESEQAALLASLNLEG